MRDEEGEAAPRSGRIRLDKWLWAARFFKTRSLATAAIESGQVRVNGERVKPARAVHVGERVSVQKSGITLEVEITDVADRRGSATEAAKLYHESEANRQQREAEIERRRVAFALDPSGRGRPTKRDRRKLEDFLNEP
ncbi:MAG TPA: RNA-binding S4 domain-containing protein [Casimicrobiaceae bacterium]|nr:RNA-binding S4 domain-containing protein [Casimicrobiaceae bacterium]